MTRDRFRLIRCNQRFKEGRDTSSFLFVKRISRPVFLDGRTAGCGVASLQEQRMMRALYTDKHVTKEKEREREKRSSHHGYGRVPYDGPVRAKDRDAPQLQRQGCQQVDTP